MLRHTPFRHGSTLISLQILPGTRPRCMARMYFGLSERSGAGARLHGQMLDSQGNPAHAWLLARLMLRPWQDKRQESTMTALSTTLAFNGTMPTFHAHPVFIAKVPGLLKNMALFLASPFIGLAYAVLLPFVGFGMLLWIATQGLRKARPAVAAPAPEEATASQARAEVIVQAAPQEVQASGAAGIAMLALKLLAAPFAGLAFVIAMPFVALAALAWAGMQAARRHAA